MKTFQIREFNAPDLNQIVSLHQKYFGDSRNKLVFEWEYSTLTKPTGVLSVSEYQGNIIGTQGFIPVKILYSGNIIESAKSESTLIDKMYRGGDLFEKLYLYGEKIAIDRGIKLFWGITTIPDLFCFLFHYEKFETIHNYLLVINYKQAKTSIFKSVITKNQILLIAYSAGTFIFSSLLFIWTKLLIFLNERMHSISIIEKLPINTEIELLINKLKRKHGDFIHIQLSDEFLQWRYFNRPYIKCKAYCVYKGEELSGYTIFSIAKDRIIIEDILFLETESGNKLIIEILKYANKVNIGLISYIANSKNEINKMVIHSLRKFGFIQFSKRGLPFIYKKDPDIKDNLIPEDWYITHTWSEGN